MSAPPHRTSDVTLAILAGGEGSRMGRAKGLLEVGGRPILVHLIERIGWPGPTLLVTAPGRERPPGAARFDREASDPVAGVGPLRGVLTALEQARTELVAVATVDMPNVSRDQLVHLISLIVERPASQGIMLARRRDDQRVIEPFPSIYRLGALEPIRDRLAQGRRSVHGLLDDPSFLAIDAPHDWPDVLWTNLNEPADLVAYERRTEPTAM